MPGATRRAAVTGALVALAAFVVANVRGTAEATRASAKEKDEAFLLPPPDQLATASLGYRSAVADYLWAHVLVTQGLRLGERRRFSTVTDFIDAISTLDPDFREPYLLADTLTTMQTVAATQDDIRAARVLLERGAKRFPNDAQMWLTLGEFVVYVAPVSYLTDPDEQRRWRIEGSEYLARAAELGSENANFGWRALGGARALQKVGERQAAIRFYIRALAVTEDPALRADIRARMQPLLGEEATEAFRTRRERFERLWKEHYPAYSITAVYVSGPPFDFAACAGGAAAPAAETAACATTWRDWAARLEGARLDQYLKSPAEEAATVPVPAPLASPATSASARP